MGHMEKSRVTSLLEHIMERYNARPKGIRKDNIKMDITVKKSIIQTILNV
jgi:hypothetical protein